MEETVALFTGDTVTVAVIVGFVGTFITALLNKSKWSSEVKRLVAIGVFVLLAALVYFQDIFPLQINSFLVVVTSVVGVGQVVYTILQPTGIFSFITGKVEGYTPQHAKKKD